MHRIVIIGGGAGGLELATRLGDRLGKSRRAEVVLIDRAPTHVWKPLLHEVATGSLDTQAHQIEFAAQARWHHFDFVLGEMTGVDRAMKRVHLAPMVDPENPNNEILPARNIEYDTLVLALGSRTHFFGVQGAQAHAVTLDTVDQAEGLRRRLLQTCIRNRNRRHAGAPETVRIAIVGGGATGIELAAELRNMERAFRKFGLHAADKESAIRVTVIEAGQRILPALPDRVSTATVQQLDRLAIEVSVGDPVIEVTRQAVKTRSGRIISADITIWAAGIKAPECLASLDGIAVNRSNQITVSQSLQSETDPSIFALGDCASCAWSDGRMVPPRAQAAHQQAMFLAKALRARIEGRALGQFAYSDYGSLVSLGPASAVGSLLGNAIGTSVMVEGLLARLMYAALYRKHLVAVSGWRRTFVGILAHALRRFMMPAVKLH